MDSQHKMYILVRVYVALLKYLNFPHIVNRIIKDDCGNPKRFFKVIM